MAGRGDDDAALRRSEERLRSLVDATFDVVFVTGPGGEVPPEASLLGLEHPAVVHPDDRARVGAQWADALARGDVFSAEYRVRDAPTGGLRDVWVRAVPVREDGGGVREWVGVASDITDRRRLEADLRRERAVLGQVVARAPAGICVLWGPELRFGLVNDRFVEAVPARGELLGRPGVELFPEAQAAAIPIIQGVRASGVARRVEDFPVPFDDDAAFEGHRFYTVTVTPVPDDGVLLTLVETTDEVRRRAHLERELSAERDVAGTLQRSLHQDRLPDLPGVATAARYLAGGERVAVGGDWYDAFPLPGGRAGLVVGDVAGHGVRAATVMVSLRASLRAYAVDGDAPSAVLARLARLSSGDDDTATVVYAVVDPAAGALTYASAGHPPPLLLAPGAEPVWLERGRSAPLGAQDPPLARDEVIAFPPGAIVVLFTDGLVEDRRAPLDAGLERVRAAALHGVRDGDDLEALADRLVTTLPHLERHDDVAVVVARAGG